MKKSFRLLNDLCISWNASCYHWTVLHRLIEGSKACQQQNIAKVWLQLHRIKVFASNFNGIRIRSTLLPLNCVIYLSEVCVGWQIDGMKLIGMLPCTRKVKTVYCFCVCFACMPLSTIRKCNAVWECMKCSGAAMQQAVPLSIYFGVYMLHAESVCWRLYHFARFAARNGIKHKRSTKTCRNWMGGCVGSIECTTEVTSAYYINKH